MLQTEAESKKKTNQRYHLCAVGPVLASQKKGSAEIPKLLRVPTLQRAARGRMSHASRPVTGRGENGTGKSRTVPVPYTEFFCPTGSSENGTGYGTKTVEALSETGRKRFSDFPSE